MFILKIGQNSKKEFNKILNDPLIRSYSLYTVRLLYVCKMNKDFFLRTVIVRQWNNQMHKKILKIGLQAKLR